MYLLNVELQEGNIRAIDIVLLLDLEVANKATVRGFCDGDETVAFTNLGWGSGGRSRAICVVYR